MYYRRKILLGLIEKFGGQVSAISLQKYLFLLTRIQPAKSFDFIPYNYGCYSIQANRDLELLNKNHLVQKLKIRENTIWKSINGSCFLEELKKEDVAAINYIFKNYSRLTNEELIRFTYLNYPFWAIKSEIAKAILTDKEYAKIEKYQIRKNDYSLFTIGYEGISLETYLNKLI